MKAWQPWRGHWQVVFVPARLHWVTTVFHKPKPPWQHCFLLQPSEDGNTFMVVEWAFMGYSATLVTAREAARLHAIVARCGAMLLFEGSPIPPKASLWHAFGWTTCVTFTRSLLGLKPRSFRQRADSLYEELLSLGAIELIAPPQRRR